MVALTDMTVQYTVMVDAHIPRLAACLADPNELVRRQALALLATLLSRVSQRSLTWLLATHYGSDSSGMLHLLASWMTLWQRALCTKTVAWVLPAKALDH